MLDRLVVGQSVFRALKLKSNGDDGAASFKAALAHFPNQS
jgi:hypothetical protein